MHNTCFTLRLCLAFISRLAAVLVFALSVLTSSAVIFTADTTIGALNTNYDAQDIVISNCVLTVDGAHTFANLRIGPGGTLTHTYSANGSIPAVNSIIDEPQVLIATNDVVLVYSNVISSTIVVKDSTHTITYTNVADFLVTIVGTQAFLRRTDTSSIPDGAMVLVSYDTSAGAAASGLTLTLTGNLEVDVSGRIDANGRGLVGNSGTGNGGEAGSPMSGAGAGYGGYGGNSSSNGIGGTTYGPYQFPATLGSGGGQGVGGVGGNGGGLIFFNISGNAMIDGLVSANGGDATNSRSGGGSGGSVRITAQTFTGNGHITADRKSVV